MRRRTAVTAAVLLTAGASRPASGSPVTDAMPDPAAESSDTCRPEVHRTLWKAYVARFVQPDGRVVDHTGGGHSTSEGQAYTLFHALVANDRATFDRVLAWADANLAGGRLGERLPGWKWGKDADGWHLLDANAASDADVWMAYTLIEAGDLWKEPRYARLGQALARTIAASEVAELPGLGPTLLPGPMGFAEQAAWRLNPSYLPIQVLRGLATSKAPGPWAEIVSSSVSVLRGASRHGLVPDWIRYTADGRFLVDAQTGPVGSYDAVRATLWSGMLHDDDPDKATIGTALQGLLTLWRAQGTVPERVNPELGTGGMLDGNVGFLAALLPEVSVLGSADELARLRASVDATRTPSGLFGTPPAYYEQNLLLFALGFVDGLYTFRPDGRLAPSWTLPCPSSAP